MTLTKAMIAALGHGRTIVFNSTTGSAWCSDERGFTVTVRRSTFNAMSLRGLIRRTGYGPGGDEYYNATDEGRRLLREAAKP
jgi:hypothetical protein